MKAGRILFLLLATLLSGCGSLGFSNGNAEKITANSAAPVVTANSSVTAEPLETAADRAENSPPQESAQTRNLLAFAAGAVIVQRPVEKLKNDSYRILDESGKIAWSATKPNPNGHVWVIELPEKTLFKKFTFDAKGFLGSDSAKDVAVEISDSETGGYQTILQVTLEKAKSGQSFAPQKEVSGRYVKLTLKNSYDEEGLISLNQFSGFGEQLTNDVKIPNVTGTYSGSRGTLRLKQTGTYVVGCYSNGGKFSGGFDGRVLVTNWADALSKGSAWITFSADGKKFFGPAQTVGFLEKGFGFGALYWEGEKTGDEPGSCPHFQDLNRPTAVKSQLTEKLESEGKAVVYGINFDFDKDIIKTEAEPILNEVVAVLKGNSTWIVKIQGHTDSIGGSAYNQKLSERRAKAVVDYLVRAGIEASRLSAAGFGMSNPVATNETEYGRALNRRVVLIKE